MPKNDAFKSFIRGAFLVASIFLFTNTAKAEYLDYNLEWNEVYTDVQQAGLKFRNTTGATLSVTDITYLLKKDDGDPTTRKIQTYTIDCDDGGSKTDTGYDSDNYAIPTSSGLLNIKFHFSTPAEIGFEDNVCYYFQVNSPYMDFAAIDTGGTANRQFINYIAAVYTPLEPYLPFFIMENGSDLASVSIQIDQPPADAEIVTRGYTYEYSGTKPNDKYGFVLFEIYNRGETTGPIVSNADSYASGSTTLSGTLQYSNGRYEVPNGDYDLVARFTDGISYESVVASRAITINIAGNASGSITIHDDDQGFAETYCSGTGSSTWFCNLTGSVVDQLKEVPPINYYIIFTDAFNTTDATSSVDYIIVPPFIDDFQKV